MRMRYTPDPVPDSCLSRLAPRARRAGGIRDGGCVCIPHISSYLPLLFPLLCYRLGSDLRRAVRVKHRYPHLSLFV